MLKWQTPTTWFKTVALNALKQSNNGGRPHLKTIHQAVSWFKSDGRTDHYSSPSPSQLRLCNVRVIFSMLIVSVDLIAFINIKTDVSLLNSEAKRSFVQINHRFAKFKLLDHPINFTSTECFNQHLRKFTRNPTLKDNSLVFSNMLSSVTNKILSRAQIKSETFCVGIWMLSCHVKYC